MSVVLDSSLLAKLKFINPDALQCAPVYTEPYTFTKGSGFILEERLAEIKATFPSIDGAGSTPLGIARPVGAMKLLCEELMSPEFALLFGQKLGINLTSLVPFIEFRGHTNEGDGYIHPDIKDKVVSLLIYMNDTWEHGRNGCLRILNNGHDIDDYAAQIEPLTGNFVGFIRCDHSMHGHYIHVGERRSIQMTWRTCTPDDPKSVFNTA